MFDWVITYQREWKMATWCRAQQHSSSLERIQTLSAATAEGYKSQIKLQSYYVLLQIHTNEAVMVFAVTMPRQKQSRGEGQGGRYRFASARSFENCKCKQKFRNCIDNWPWPVIDANEATHDTDEQGLEHHLHRMIHYLPSMHKYFHHWTGRLIAFNTCQRHVLWACRSEVVSGLTYLCHFLSEQGATNENEKAKRENQPLCGIDRMDAIRGNGRHKGHTSAYIQELTSST